MRAENINTAICEDNVSTWTTTCAAQNWNIDHYDCSDIVIPTCNVSNGELLNGTVCVTNCFYASKNYNGDLYYCQQPNTTDCERWIAVNGSNIFLCMPACVVNGSMLYEYGHQCSATCLTFNMSAQNGTCVMTCLPVATFSSVNGMCISNATSLLTAVVIVPLILGVFIAVSAVLWIVYSYRHRNDREEGEVLVEREGGIKIKYMPYEKLMEKAKVVKEE